MRLPLWQVLEQSLMLFPSICFYLTVAVNILIHSDPLTGTYARDAPIRLSHHLEGLAHALREPLRVVVRHVLFGGS